MSRDSSKSRSMCSPILPLCSRGMHTVKVKVPRKSSTQSSACDHLVPESPRSSQISFYTPQYLGEDFRANQASNSLCVITSIGPSTDLPLEASGPSGNSSWTVRDWLVQISSERIVEASRQAYEGPLHLGSRRLPAGLASPPCSGRVP
jgi:hypothetical protein